MSIESQKLIIPSSVADAIEEHTGQISSITPVGGGCIANASRISGTKGTFFVKWGQRDVAKTFAAEAKGLQTLRDAGSPLQIPEVVSFRGGHDGYILIDWLDQGHASNQSWEAFGRELAQLHRVSQRQYGFEEDNFIGRLPQVNAQKDTWPAFFRDCRLEPQAQMARASGKWRAQWNRWLENIYNRLDTLIPDLPEASLVHGDLWGGNFMTLVSGRVALIDPAVYYGHREVDLAMTELFGGFKGVFYEAYWEAWPVEHGYSERKELYNLYHLMNHLNLFGLSYERGVGKVLKRFGS